MQRSLPNLFPIPISSINSVMLIIQLTKGASPQPVSRSRATFVTVRLFRILQAMDREHAGAAC